ncbi:MAG TPA: T9SS type A sorting domain-containing protein [Ignavibacteria bacterium]|nr:T9SS type A sorting domain-containing protein [Ignavibacteria bacterium]
MTKKYFLTVFFIIFSFTVSLKAQLLVESFDYPAGDSLGAHGWVHFSPDLPTNRLLVTAPGLDYTGYQMPGVGNATTLSNTGQDAYKPLSSNVTSGSLYSFFLVKVDTARIIAGGGDYFFGYLPSTSTTNYTCRVYIRKSVTLNNTFAFGITKNAISGGAVLWSDSVYTLGTKYLVCAKYTFVTGTTNDDLVSLFVFSSGVPSTEPAPTLGPVTSTTTDVLNIGRFALRQGLATTSANLVLDEIYSGTDWTTLLPVELSSFSSAVNKNIVELNWATTQETNNMGFEIERKSNSSQSSGEWKNIGNVSGNGTSSSVHNYSFTDRNLSTGNYSYRLKQIDFNGNFEYFNLQNEVNIGIPSVFSLSQNYPNPFNPATTINFDLPVDSKVNIKLFDISGREAATVINEFKTAGYHTVNFNASGLTSGVYFYNLTGANFSVTRKMLLVK